MNIKYTEGTAFLAGMLIGIGDIALMQTDNKYLGALLFSVALLSIIHLKLPLYTGRVGTVLKKHDWYNCLAWLVYNIGGAITVVAMYGMMGGMDQILSTAQAKFSVPTINLFLAGVLCNVLIHVAVMAKTDVITVLCIMAFILCGFRHSIADAPYAFLSGNMQNVANWLVVVGGNTVGAILTESLGGEK